MARLVTAGAEIQEHSTTDIGSPDGYTPSAVPTVTETTTIRGGSVSWNCLGDATNASYRAFPFTAPSLGATVYARAYVYVSALPASTAKIAALLTAADSALVSARLTPAGALQLWNDAAGTQIGSDSATVIAPGEWYRLQLRLLINTGAVDQAELRVVDDTADRTTEEAISGSSLTISDTHAGRFRAGWLDSPGVAATSAYVDDVAVNDSTGTKQNTWPGDGLVIYTPPIVNGLALGSWTDCSTAASVKDGLNKVPPVGLADHTNVAHTGAACHQIRVAVNTAQTSGWYCRMPQTMGAPIDVNVGSSSTGSLLTFGGTSGAQQVASSIPFGANVVVSQLGLWLAKNGTPTDSVVGEIRADNAGTPSDVVLATTAPILPAGLPATIPTKGTYPLVNPVTLNAGNTYWIVVRRTGATDGTNNYMAHTVTNSGSTVIYPEAVEAELQTSGSWTLSTTKVLRMIIYTTNGSFPCRVMQGVLCHGQAVTGAKGGTVSLTPGSPTTPGTSGTFNYGDNVGVAGTYPSNWRWAKTAVAYDASPLPAASAGGITKNSGSGTNAVMACAYGIVYEYQPPQPRAWRRLQRTSDSTFWWAKQAPSTTTAELAGGGTVTAEPGDWVIYQEPQVVAGGDLPSTTTTITSDTINSGYTDA